MGIDWADGFKSRFDVRNLRLSCVCALCVDEWTGKSKLEPESIPPDVHPTRISAVGRYAISIDWSDGHATGIYSFERLRALADGVAPEA